MCISLLPVFGSPHGWDAADKTFYVPRTRMPSAPRTPSPLLGFYWHFLRVRPAGPSPGSHFPSLVRTFRTHLTQRKRGSCING